MEGNTKMIAANTSAQSGWKEFDLLTLILESL